MNKLTIAAVLAMTGLVACDNGKDTAESGAATTGGTTTGTTGGTTTGGGAPTASVTWGGASVDVAVAGGPGAYWFGMAETTGCDDCWTGEDCVYGYDASGTTLAYCHDGGDTGTSLAYGGDIPMDFSGIQDEIYQQASQQLERFAENSSIDEAHRHIVMGRPEVEIHAKAEELEADLIVVGSHGRHGLALLMGSTANGVLHGAKRDVLAVRVGGKG